MKQILSLFTGLFTAVSLAQADLKYSFIDLDYTLTDYDHTAIDNAHGVRGALSISPMPNFFIVGGVAASKADSDINDWDVEATRLQLGVGGYVDLDPSFHLVGEAGVVYSDVDSDFSEIARDELGVYAKPGVRVLALEVLELNANLRFSTIDEEDFMVGVGAGVNLMSNFQIKGGIEFADEANIYSAGLRLQW